MRHQSLSLTFHLFRFQNEKSSNIRVHFTNETPNYTYWKMRIKSQLSHGLNLIYPCKSDVFYTFEMIVYPNYKGVDRKYTILLY